MPIRPGETGPRTRRAETNTPSQTSRDNAEATTAGSSDVRSITDAMKWMVEGIYLVEGESVTARKLAHVMFQIAAAVPKLTKHGINALRAAAFILEGLVIDQEGKEIGDAVAKHFGALLKEHVAKTLTEVKKTTADIARHGETMAAAAQTVQDMGTSRMAHGTDESTGDNLYLVNAVETILARTEQVAIAINEEKEQRETQMSYAAKVRGNVTPSYEQAALVAKGNLLDKQVVVRRTQDTDTDQLASLTERELVEKATVALELMGIAASDKPQGMKFIGAKRTHSGAVIYTLDAAASADYLRREDVMRTFMDHFGGTSALHARTYQVVVEHVPVSFDVARAEALRKVEETSELPPRAIHEARWIKPAHLRSAGQRVAFLIMGLTTREAANRVLNYGVIVEGKHCRTRKLLPEPKRCVKCQGYGHFARECKSPKDVCARCAGEHRTMDQSCPAGKSRPMRCANCAKEGHGAADRGCDVYQGRLAQLRTRDPDARFRLFPTNDPDTWGRAEDHAPMDEFDGAWRNDPRDQARRDAPPQRGGASGRGRGGTGPRMGSRGGATLGMGRPGNGGRPREIEIGQATERAQSRNSQHSTGNLRQRTLAETWTTSGGRMGAFGMHPSAGRGATPNANPGNHTAATTTTNNNNDNNATTTDDNNNNNNGTDIGIGTGIGNNDNGNGYTYDDENNNNITNNTNNSTPNNTQSTIEQWSSP